MRNISNKVAEKSNTHILFSIFLFIKTRSLLGNVKRHKKHTLMLSVQQLLRERATMLRYTHNAYLA